MRSLLPLLVLLACPLMMVWMMRGGHGHGAGAHRESGHRSEPSADERIAELEREVARLRTKDEVDAPRVIANRR